MAFWDRFRRNQKVILPEEVSQYYQSARRERVGVAILLGIVALIVTVLVASALFFGGRFAYRKIAGKDKKTPISQTEQKEEIKTQQENSSQNQGDVEETPQPQPTPPTPQPQPAPRPTNPTPTTPALGDDSLPHTGDPGM
jgi:hypothetical protein